MHTSISFRARNTQDSSRLAHAQNDAYLGMDVGFVRECCLLRATNGRPYRVSIIISPTVKFVATYKCTSNLVGATIGRPLRKKRYYPNHTAGDDARRWLAVMIALRQVMLLCSDARLTPSDIYRHIIRLRTNKCNNLFA